MSEQSTESVLDALRVRKSVRAYSGERLEAALVQRVLSAAHTLHLVTDVAPRMEVVTGVKQTRRILSHLVDSYGLLNNVPHLIVGVLPQDSPVSRIGLGYALEMAVLEATRLDLGTCWVTGTYSPRRAAEQVRLREGERVGAVCALGRPAGGVLGRLHNRVVSSAARRDFRRPLHQIAFSARWGQPWPAGHPHSGAQEALELARLAPSARNLQPWRFVVLPDAIVLGAVRDAPIDCGIVMAHVALACEALGYPGEWTVRWRDSELARTCGFPVGAFAAATYSFA
jgi:nitroreductase